MRNGRRRLAIAQINSVRNDLAGNMRIMTEQVQQATTAGAELIVFPELALPGYLVDDRFADAAVQLDSPEMQKLCSLSKSLDVCFGFIEETSTSVFYNSAIYLAQERIQHVHRKIYLPTYGVFDERRYFGAGWDVSAFDTAITRSATLICGDAWHPTLAYMAAHDGADVIYILAASSTEGLTATTPCDQAWQWMCRSYALTLSCFVVFANMAGGQMDDLRFWGGSFVVGPDGEMIAESGTDLHDLLIVELDLSALRSQRIRLPFRRDDSLAHTVALGQSILKAKNWRGAAMQEREEIELASPKPR